MRRIVGAAICSILAAFLLPVQPHPTFAVPSPPAEAAEASIVEAGTVDAPLHESHAADVAAAPASASTHQLLRPEVQRLIQATNWRGSDWGVLAVSLERGDTLVSMESDRPLAPASNQKLFTSAAALERLGPDFRFPTYLLTDGTIEQGVLEGDLILYGTGDPAISDRLLGSASEPFREFAQALTRKGVHTVSGDVIGDGTFFNGPTRHPSWRPNSLDHWYAAPVTALTFNENVVTLRIRPGGPGNRPQVRTVPEGAELPLLNTGVSVTGSPAAPLQVIRNAPDDSIQVRGQMNLRAGEVWRVMTVSDPEAFAASGLRHALAEEGIRVEGASRSLGTGERSSVSGLGLVAPAFIPGSEGRTLRTLAVHRSPPVSELLEVVNRNSHNLYSEALLFALGRITSGDGSFVGGSQALEEFLVRRVEIPGTELSIQDGSGLSNQNRATPSSFVRLLYYVSASPYADTFWASLPEAGNRLELGRMYRSPAAANLRAKTGTISRVSALSGVVRTGDGDFVLFSVLANNVPSTWGAKRVEDDIGIRLASFVRPAGSGASDPSVIVESGPFGPRLSPQVPVDALR